MGAVGVFEIVARRHAPARDQYRDLLKRMFPEGPHEAWIAAGRYYIEGGWHTQAQPFIERALEIKADNACALELLTAIKEAEEKTGEATG